MTTTRIPPSLVEFARRGSETPSSALDHLRPADGRKYGVIPGWERRIYKGLPAADFTEPNQAPPEEPKP